MPRCNFATESQHEGVVAGIDEAGRGPWAGPVVAAVVILDRQRFPRGVNDSKQVPREKREALYEKITALAVFGVGICSCEEIDHYNILGATMQAMRRAFAALPVKPDVALVDGNRLPDLPCVTHGIIDGDTTCRSIAAASIIAKVTRDRMMRELAREFPHYGWERNAGYGTKEHQAALALHGVTPHHRRSFASIRRLVDAVVAA